MHVMPSMPGASSTSTLASDRAQGPNHQSPREFDEWTRTPPLSRLESKATSHPTCVEEIASAVVMRETDRDAQLYPWALRALYGWSQVHPQMQTIARALVGDAGAHAADSFAAAASRAPCATERVSLIAPGTGAMSLRWLSTPPRSRAMSTGDAAVQGDEPSSSVPMLVAPWPERLLRRTLGHDGSVTWWLRDYRLSEQDIVRAADHWMASSGREESARLIINGVEVRRTVILQHKDQSSWR